MKNIVRKTVLDNRKAMKKEDVELKSHSICDFLLESSAYKNSDLIMAYIDFRNEVQTESLIKRALSDGKKIVIPISVVDSKQLILSELLDYDSELESGAYGILEPREEFIRETDPKLVDLVLIPGVAFDRKGYRIGYGAGYYDRFLERVRPEIPKIALGFDLQMVADAYPDAHDFPVDSVITESGVINCREEN